MDAAARDADSGMNVRWWLLALTCLVSLALFSAGCAARSVRVEAPLVQVGDVVTVIWDCLPEWIAQFASQQFGAALGPCYGEALRVDRVRADGWLDVTAQDGSRWRVNPTRMAAVQVQQSPQKAD